MKIKIAVMFFCALFLAGCNQDNREAVVGTWVATINSENADAFRNRTIEIHIEKTEGNALVVNSNRITETIKKEDSSNVWVKSGVTNHADRIVLYMVGNALSRDDQAASVLFTYDKDSNTLKGSDDALFTGAYDTFYEKVK